MQFRKLCKFRLIRILIKLKYIFNQMVKYKKFLTFYFFIFFVDIEKIFNIWQYKANFNYDNKTKR